MFNIIKRYKIYRINRSFNISKILLPLLFFYLFNKVKLDFII